MVLHLEYYAHILRKWKRPVCTHARARQWNYLSKPKCDIPSSEIAAALYCHTAPMQPNRLTGKLLTVSQGFFYCPGPAPEAMKITDTEDAHKYTLYCDCWYEIR